MNELVFLLLLLLLDCPKLLKQQTAEQTVQSAAAGHLSLRLKYSDQSLSIGLLTLLQATLMRRRQTDIKAAAFILGCNGAADGVPMPHEFNNG